MSPVNAPRGRKGTRRPKRCAHRGRPREPQSAPSEQALLAEHQARLVAERERARLKVVFHGAPVAIISVQADATHAIVNRRFMELTGSPLAPPARRPVLPDLHHPHGASLADEDMPDVRAWAGESLEAQEYALVRRDGTQVPVAVWATPVRDRFDAVREVVMALQDITARKRLQVLERDWVAFVTHDLRAPLQTFTTGVQVLQEHLADAHLESEHAIVGKLQLTARAMQRIVDGLLDLGRLESGMLTLQQTIVDLGDLIPLMTQATFTSDAARILIALEDVPAVWAAPDHLERVVSNLLSNALKFSPAHAPVRIGWRKQDARVILTVSDHGPGIPREEVERVFDRYFSTRASRAKGGIGLGLHLSRLLVEAQGGQCWVESTVGEGSTFCVSLRAS